MLHIEELSGVCLLCSVQSQLWDISCLLVRISQHSVHIQRLRLLPYKPWSPVWAVGDLWGQGLITLLNNTNITIKFLKFGTLEIFAVIYLKTMEQQTVKTLIRLLLYEQSDLGLHFLQPNWLVHWNISPNGENWMASSVEPDQTSPQGKLWINTVLDTYYTIVITLKFKQISLK